MNASPVGFFDSGFGGLCIRDAFAKACPGESTVYLADSANCPYGNRPSAEIVALSRANTLRLLSEYGCKMVVVACNTATAAAIDVLRAEYPEVPFIGIEPAVKPAAMMSRTGVVGVLATAGTFGGRLYNETRAKFAKDVTVVATVADEFVEEVEKLAGRRVEELAASERERIGRVVARKIEPLLDAGADAIVLGCTHFPHLRSVIERVASGRATVIDPSGAVAAQARRVLDRLGLRAPSGAVPSHVFVQTGNGGGGLRGIHAPSTLRR